MTWNGNHWDFEGKRKFQADLRKKIKTGLNGSGNKFSKAFEIYLKIAQTDGLESQQQVLRTWNKVNKGDDYNQIMHFFIQTATSDWFTKNEMNWRGAGSDQKGWTYHVVKWKDGNWIHTDSYFDPTGSWDDWDD